MHMHIDKYAHLQSLIHQWDPRFKIGSLFLLIMVFSFISNIYVVPLLFVIALIFGFLSKIPVFFILSRMKLPIYFFTMGFLVLPITSGGTSLISIYFLDIYQEGILMAVLISVRGISILLIVIIMFGSSPLDQSIRTFYQLKVPEKLVDIFLFTYRYIFLFLDNLRKMKLSIRLRGYQGKFTLTKLPLVIGLMVNHLIRCYEQTDRIYHSMILRGYHGKFYNKEEIKYQFKDIYLSIVVLLIVISLIILEIYI